MNRYQAFVSLPSATHRAARCIGHSGKDLLFQTLARRLCNVRDLVCQPSYRVACCAWGEPVGLRFLQSSSRAIATR